MQKSREALSVTIDEEENLNDEDFSTWEGNSLEQNLGLDVYGAVDLQHPLSFDDRNICQIEKGKKLKKSESRGIENHLRKVCIDGRWESAKKTTLY